MQETKRHVRWPAVSPAGDQNQEESSGESHPVAFVSPVPRGSILGGWPGGRR